MERWFADRLCGIGDEAARELEQQLTVHVAADMGAIEIRTVGGRGLHELTLAETAAVAASVRAAGLIVPVVDTPIGSWAVDVGTSFDRELRCLHDTAERAALLGCHRLRVMSYPNDGRCEDRWRDEVLRRMERLTATAADLGVVLLHENCQGWASISATHTRRMLERIDSPHLRLVFDIGNGLAYGYDAVAFLDEVLPWVEHVHVKDGHRSPIGGDPVYCWPGKGTAGVAACIERLERHGYTGWYSIEPHLALIPHRDRDEGDDAKAALYLRYAWDFAGLAGPLVSRMGGRPCPALR
jgi:sugar phosphate isomerase/epimerase